MSIFSRIAMYMIDDVENGRDIDDNLLNRWEHYDILLKYIIGKSPFLTEHIKTGFKNFQKSQGMFYYAKNYLYTSSQTYAEHMDSLYCSYDELRSIDNQSEIIALLDKHGEEIEELQIELNKLEYNKYISYCSIRLSYLNRIYGTEIPLELLGDLVSKFKYIVDNFQWEREHHSPTIFISGNDTKSSRILDSENFYRLLHEERFDEILQHINETCVILFSEIQETKKGINQKDVANKEYRLNSCRLVKNLVKDFQQIVNRQTRLNYSVMEYVFEEMCDETSDKEQRNSVKLYERLRATQFQHIQCASKVTLA